MKCPKCQFENPSGIRYCLHCGAPMLPPPPKKQKRSEKTKRTPLRVGVFGGAFIGLSFLFLLAIVILGIQSHHSSNDSLLSETTQGLADPKRTLIPYDSRTNYEYVDLTTHTLSIPDSSLKIEFPAYSVGRYDYDSAHQQLIFEIETFDGLTITFTSSRLNATPYTKSEAEASLKTGLYHEIAGKEDEYYYILPSNGPTATATIVDCIHNRSTNITVYDDHFISDGEEEITSKETNLFGEDSSQDTAHIESQVESMLDQEEIQEATQEETILDQENVYSISSSPVGSQKAVDALEELLRSTHLNA